MPASLPTTNMLHLVSASWAGQEPQGIIDRMLLSLDPTRIRAKWQSFHRTEGLRQIPVGQADFFPATNPALKTRWANRTNQCPSRAGSAPL